jgi:hypothetical protein
MTSAASSATLAVTHLFLAAGVGGAVPVVSARAMTSSALRGTGVMS